MEEKPQELYTLTTDNRDPLEIKLARHDILTWSRKKMIRLHRLIIMFPGTGFNMFPMQVNEL